MARAGLGGRAVAGFLAGALAVVTFHQVTILLLSMAGALPQGAAYATRPIPPLGVPQVLNLAFWGGVWGIVYALLVDGRRVGALPPLVVGFLFGAVLPTLFGWFVIPALKGAAGGFPPPSRIWIGPLVNGVWGLGTALFLAWLAPRLAPSRRLG